MNRRTIAVLGRDGRTSELMGRSLPEGWDWMSFEDPETLDAESLRQAEGIFSLQKTMTAALPANVLESKVPVFVDAVCETTANLPKHDGIVRINGWPGFLNRPLLELAAPEERRPNAERLLDELGWGFRWVADEPGLVTARILAMVVNEACLAVREGVSVPAEVDTAMRLGAAYPSGPFEWASRIGPERIVRLLGILAEKDPLHTPCPGMLGILSSKA
jgi:3-hydroxybutyryl-CoA dehydrogenase